MSKKLFSRLLLLAIFQFSPIAAYCYDFEVDGIYYNVTSEEESTLEVTYLYYYMEENQVAYEGEVEIPEEVTYEGNTFKVTSIGEFAFYDCFNLKKLYLPSAIVQVNKAAFCRCISLEEINLPVGLQTIGANAFQECYSLKNIDLPEGLLSIDAATFASCLSLEELNLPSSIKSIGGEAFCECYSLKNIDLPEGLLSIDTSAFMNCTSIETIKIPGSVTYIGESILFGCSNLKEAIIEDGAVEADIYMFLDCINLSKVKLAENWTYIPAYTFGFCSSLEEFEFPSNIKSIGEQAFYQCGFKQITIPKSVEEIEGGILSGCASLTEILVEEGNQNYCSLDGVLYDIDMTTLVQFPCGQGESFSVPDGIKRIENDAFNEANNLSEIILPSSVSELGYLSIADCQNLRSLYSLNPIPPVGEEYTDAYDITYYPFSELDTKACTLYVPIGSKEAYQEDKYWKVFENIEEIEVTMVNSLEAKSNPQEKGRYTLDGRATNASSKGINIVKFSDGKTKKVVVK